MIRVYSQYEGAGFVATYLEPSRRDPFCVDPMDFREQVGRLDGLHRARRHLKMRSVEALLRLARLHPDVKASVPGNAYAVHSGTSALALAAATAKTVIYINAAAANQPSIAEISVGFDGVTASAVPVLMALNYGTKATNSTPGTASTSFTPLQLRGWPTQASANTAANACTSEPTVLVTNKQWLIPPTGGLVLSFAMGREATGVASGTAISGNQIALTLTAPAIVNSRSYVEFEE